MKKIPALLLALIVSSTTVNSYADGFHGGYHGNYHGGYHYSGGGDWLFPALVGGLIVSEIVNSTPVYPVYSQPVYTQPQVIYEQPAISYVPPPAPVQIAPVVTPASWYFCPNTQTYYPYVTTCASAWQLVSTKPLGVQ